MHAKFLEICMCLQWEIIGTRGKKLFSCKHKCSSIEIIEI